MDNRVAVFCIGSNSERREAFLEIGLLLGIVPPENACTLTALGTSILIKIWSVELLFDGAYSNPILDNFLEAL